MSGSEIIAKKFLDVPSGLPYISAIAAANLTRLGFHFSLVR